MKKVSIYSTPTCHFCQMAKEFFKENNIPYEEFNVGADQARRTEMIQKSGQMGVPVIEIDGDILVGFNQAKLEELLDIKK